MLPYQICKYKIINICLSDLEKVESQENNTKFRKFKPLKMPNRKIKKDEETKEKSKFLKHTSKHMAEDDQESSTSHKFII